MIQSIGDFYAEARPLIEAFNAFIKKNSLTRVVLPDHICYKCDSTQSFEMIRGFFETQSVFMYQSMISKRRIAYIRLVETLSTDVGAITFLELSDQKQDFSQQDGFEHIEFYPIDVPYADFIKRIKEIEIVRTHIRPHHSTHDIDIAEGYIARCTEEPLIDKIKREEMF